MRDVVCVVVADDPDVLLVDADVLLVDCVVEETDVSVLVIGVCVIGIVVVVVEGPGARMSVNIHVNEIGRNSIIDSYLLSLR